MAWTAAAMLTACGGGGGGGGDAPVAPVIVAQPSDTSVVEGGEARFAVTATNATGYQWQRAPAGAGWNDIAGAVGAALSVPAVAVSDDRLQFRVLVRGEGGTEVASSTVTLTVTAAVVPPSIVAQPVGQSAIEGQQAVFSVTASGSTLAYAWQSSADEVTWQPVSGGATASLVIAATTADDNGRHYRVIVSNTAGAVTSASALLQVNPVPQAPTITRQPVDAAVTAGATVNFSVAVAGQPAPTLAWQRSVGGGAWTEIPGANGSSITLPAAALSDNGLQVRVVASNASGSVTSEAATLRVSPALVAPAFTLQPLSVTVAAGGPAGFAVKVEGTPQPTVQWQLKTATADWTNLNGETRLSYAIAAADLGASGNRYRAVASSSAGTLASSEAVLTVTPLAPVFSTQPRAVSVVAPQPATFSVAVTAAPAAAFQWQSSADGVRWNDVAGANAASYTVASTNVLRDNNALYRVVASNAVAAVTSTEVRLTVTPLPAAQFCSGPANSGWCWANPRPQGSTLRGIANAGFGTYVAVGTQGHIQRTIDRGLTWTRMPAPDLRNLTAVDFADDNVGIAVGEGGALLRSVDGGQHWAAVASGVGVELTAVSFGSPTVALAVGAGGTMLRSADAGQSWQAVASGTSARLNSVAWADESTVSVVSAGAAILRSVDAGRVWSTVWFSGSARSGFDSIAFATPTVGVAVNGSVSSHLAVRTTDGGLTWAAVASPIAPVIVFSGLHGYLIGGSGAPSETRDGGATWGWAGGTPHPAPANTALLAAAFESESLGLGAGTGGLVLAMDTLTEPGGRTELRDDLTSLAFADDHNGIAVSNSAQAYVSGGSRLLRSTDGGKNWVDPGGPLPYFLRDVALADSRTAIAVGGQPGDGVILRSTDGGVHWTRVRTLPGLTMVSAAFAGTELGLAVAVRGSDSRAFIYRSTDAGRTWSSPFNTGVTTLNSVALADGNTAVAVGNSGGLFRSIDAGLTWQAVTSPTTKDLQSVAVNSQGTALAVGKDATVLRSRDGGATWSPVALGDTRHLVAVALKDNEGYILGEAGVVFSSSDGGASWVAASTGAGGELLDVASTALGSAVVVGSGGTVLTTTTTGRAAPAASGLGRQRTKQAH